MKLAAKSTKSKKANFYRQIRNFRIDIQQVRAAGVAALHYQVAQATSLFNVDFIASSKRRSAQKAIFAENGSGGVMSDLTFTGGKFGICNSAFSD
jgi:hypothetical protein